MSDITDISGVTLPGVANAPGAPSQDSNGTDRRSDQQLRSLQDTDHKIRAMERRRMAAQGQVSEPAGYQYIRGDDGRFYAIAGSVSVQLSHEENGDAPNNQVGPSEGDYKLAARAYDHDDQEPVIVDLQG